MQSVIHRKAVPDDLETVTELERLCFPVSEAADRNAFSLRLCSFHESFWVSEKDSRIISMINGMTTHNNDLCDEMYEGTELYSPEGEWLMLFGVACRPSCQNNGHASRLMYHVIEETKRCGREGIVLTCKQALIPFYSRFGFINEGISRSVHGGAKWYQMRLTFREELFRCAEKGGEYSFYHRGKRYLLYGWSQCDGLFLNVSDDMDNIIWQTSGRTFKECSERFKAFFMKFDTDTGI